MRTALIAAICVSIFLGHIASAQENVATTPDNVCGPNPPTLSAEQLSLPFSTCARQVKEGLAERHPDQNKITVKAYHKNKLYQYSFLKQKKC